MCKKVAFLHLCYREIYFEVCEPFRQSQPSVCHSHQTVLLTIDSYLDSYDMKSMSFNFGVDIFIIFEMPRSSYQRPVDKNNISLLFRPSVIRGPWIVLHIYRATTENLSQARSNIPTQFFFERSFLIRERSFLIRGRP